MIDNSTLFFIIPFQKKMQCGRTYFEYHMLKDMSLSTETKITEFANSVDLDEVAHDEAPHLDLHCLPSSLQILNMI